MPILHMEDEAIEVLKCIQELFSDEEEKNKFLTFIKLKKKEEYDSMKNTVEKLLSTQF